MKAYAKHMHEEVMLRSLFPKQNNIFSKEDTFH